MEDEEQKAISGCDGCIFNNVSKDYFNTFMCSTCIRSEDTRWDLYKAKDDTNGSSEQ